jgi:hypothetical protein
MITKSNQTYLYLVDLFIFLRSNLGLDCSIFDRDRISLIKSNQQYQKSYLFFVFNPERCKVQLLYLIGIFILLVEIIYWNIKVVLYPTRYLF